MPGQLERTAREFLSALDAVDLDRMIGMVAAEPQGIDEVSRRWLRGRGELESYLRQLAAAVSDVRTELRDTDEREWGDAGLLTCWLDQDYTMDGVSQHVTAPTTIVFRREDDEWKLALFHSIPLPEPA